MSGHLRIHETPPAGRFREIPRVDRLLALAVVVVGVLEAFTTATAYGAAQNPQLWWVAQAVLTGGILLWRRRAPVLTLVLMVIAQYLWHRQGNEGCPVWQLASLLVVFHTAGAERPWKVGGAWAWAAIAVFDSGAIDHRPLPLEEVIFLTVMFGAAWGTGVALRAHATRGLALAERNARLEAERERRAREAVAAERARIARELHDTISHSVSVMVLQAGGVRRLLGEERPRERDILLDVEKAGRQAVQELRVMLGALRAEDAPGGEPGPGLARLDDLVARLRAVGLDVSVTVEGEPRELPPGLDLSAYRIVQEGLTNVVKHAGRTRARVRLAYAGDEVRLEIENEGAGEPAADTGLDGGHGLAGMRERVALFGGTFSAAPREQGGFSVLARLPISEGAPA
ncbi:sensor histidine kinase [Bailinhaonella thermotolerans]|uniref:histidine kinase n=1 Tax=Bailinhaonella thermotolerans TaxID=1070861 RepID=A0A3A4AN01_9ACTN|nr:sensor histidine kinase [Bailinhaonella thermotolerans]RJL20531.1 sensor histidine kinase [Bailinhaonella thermotolerans]